MDQCCCGNQNNPKPACDADCSPESWFDSMLQNCLQYAKQEHEAGRPIVGILCEYTPRELIMAAGGVPVCLCGGSAETIPAAEEHLPANLCPLIKSTFGYHVLKKNPFLEMADLIVGETTCDGKKKMYELLGESRDVYVLELPQKAGDSDAMIHWTAELRKFRDFLQERYKVEITDCAIRRAIGTMNHERDLRRRLSSLMQAERPPLTGRQMHKFKTIIPGIETDTAQYEKAIELYGSQTPACCGSAAPVRVMITGVPIVTGAERVLDIIEQSGGLIVAAENCTGLKPILEDVDADASDPLTALAEKYFHLPCSVLMPNDHRLETLQQLTAEYRPDCVIELVWQACLTYDVETARIRRLVEEELGLPYLRIETDYSPSDSARIAVRVEALYETVRDRGCSCCGSK